MITVLPSHEPYVPEPGEVPEVEGSRNPWLAYEADKARLAEELKAGRYEEYETLARRAANRHERAAGMRFVAILDSPWRWRISDNCRLLFIRCRPCARYFLLAHATGFGLCCPRCGTDAIPF